jgi:hypothetical protein
MAILDDATLFLADFGVSVTAGAVSGLGILDQNSEMLLGDSVVSVDYALTCQASLFGALDYGSSITVDGNSYEVRHQPMVQDDGTFCVVPLALVISALNALLLEAGDELLAEDATTLLLEA